MKTHNLKTQSEFYRQIISGLKTFELRKNDRYLKVGDTLKFKQLDNTMTGLSVNVKY